MSIWQEREASRLRWLLKVLYSGTFLVYLFVAGPWHWTSYYLRHHQIAVRNTTF